MGAKEYETVGSKSMCVVKVSWLLKGRETESIDKMSPDLLGSKVVPVIIRMDDCCLLTRKCFLNCENQFPNANVLGSNVAM